MKHGGSVMAPDAELAMHYARELYGRRQESVAPVGRAAGRHPRPERSGPAPAAARPILQEAGRLRHARQARGRPGAVGADEAEGDEGMTPEVGALVPATRNALELLLLAMADDEFVIGFSDSEWTGIAPLLEEDVAMSSIAQDELGHAAALYRAARRGPRRRSRRRRNRLRPPAATGYRHARLLDHGRGDWAMRLPGDTCTTRPTASGSTALAASSFGPLRQLVGKIAREERYHRMHVAAWLERLATTPGEPRAPDSSTAIGPLVPDAATVFTPLPASWPRRGRHHAMPPVSELETIAGGPTIGPRARPARPADARARPVMRPTRRTAHSDAFRWRCGRVHRRPRGSEPGATW